MKYLKSAFIIYQGVSLVVVIYYYEFFIEAYNQFLPIVTPIVEKMLYGK